MKSHEDCGAADLRLADNLQIAIHDLLRIDAGSGLSKLRAQEHIFIIMAQGLGAIVGNVRAV